MSRYPLVRGRVRAWVAIMGPILVAAIPPILIIAAIVSAIVFLARG